MFIVTNGESRFFGLERHLSVTFVYLIRTLCGKKISKSYISKISNYFYFSLCISIYLSFPILKSAEPNYFYQHFECYNAPSRLEKNGDVKVISATGRGVYI